MRSRYLVLLVPLVMLAGCSANGQLELDQAAVADATAAPKPAAPDVEPTGEAPVEPTPPVTPGQRLEGAPMLGAPAADRIVVATETGQVYLIGPEGQQRLDLNPTGTAGHPVWSPDGRRIAWSQRDASGFSISSANADGTEPRRAGTLFSGYFGYWSPTSQQLGFLGNAPPGTGLVLDTGTGSDLDAVIDSDTFYYFSWNPDGTRWVVHSGSGFSIVTLDGTRTQLDLDPARFRAPIWAANGSILLAVRTNDQNMIVRLDPDTGDFEPLLKVGDLTNFVLDPTGRYLAIESLEIGDGETDPGSGITVSTSIQPSVAEVLVYDMQSGIVRQILSQRTGGFWWSPDGETLALLVQEEAATPEFAQWLMWRPDESFRTERFKITPAFGTTYVPFFDQFAQSVTPWSPDSSLFVYSGFDQAGDPGVFVQPARSGVAAQRISDDSGLAFWSPT